MSVKKPEGFSIQKAVNALRELDPELDPETDPASDSMYTWDSANIAP